MKKISNFKFQISNFQGFTLIELLVSIGLFAVISALIITVLFASFRASKKSEVILSMKQSGSSVMSRIVNGVRFAKSLDDPVACVPEATDLKSITITSFDGGQTKYSCPGGDTESISSNSAVLVDENTVEVSDCSFTCSQKTTSDPPIIIIQFKLSAANATDFAETSSSIPFKTSVTLRNYNR